MKKHLLLFFTGILYTCSYGQRSGIGTTSPHISSAFEIKSTTGGFLIPRMSQTQRDAIASPELGLMIYNTTRACQEFYNASWFSLCDQGTIKIIAQPVSSAPVCSGSGIQTLSVTATGKNLNYLWRKNGVAIANGGVFSGQGTASLTLTNATLSDAGNYEVVVSDSSSALVSYNVVLSVYDTTITNTASGITCPNSVVTLSAYAKGAIINWYDVPTGGVSLHQGTSFTTPALLATTIYYADATVSGCTAPARTAVAASVNILPTILSTTEATGSGCQVTLVATATPGAIINWYANATGGTALRSGTSFLTPPITSTKTYYVEAVNNYGCTVSRTPVKANYLAPEETVITATGKTWYTYNLGATAQGCYSTDHTQYGSLYQWGRGSDGHQLINWISSSSATAVNGYTQVLSYTDNPGNSSFIGSTGDYYGDWRSPQNNNLWQGYSGINNPCPAGYRLPTSAEWTAESSSANIVDAASAFSSPLKLVYPGERIDSGRIEFGNVGYWSSTVYAASPTGVEGFRITSSSVLIVAYQRRAGLSVRCMKD